MEIKIKDLVANRRNRLKEWIDQRYAGSQAKMVEDIGINQGELSGLLKSKSFGEKKARSLEDQAGMPYSYLDLMDYEEEIEQFWKDESNKKRLSDQNLIEIIQYNDVNGSMGSGLILSDQPGQITGWRVTKEWITKNIPSNTGDSNIRIVTGFGDSMKGMFNSGDPLLIDVGITDIKWDGVYFFRIGDEGFIKRLQRIPGQGIRALSANPEYEAWTITPDMDFHILGLVLKVWKGSSF